MHPSDVQIPLRPYNAFMLNVGDGHWLYVEEVGCQSGIPVIFLHGGPGSGSQHFHRSLFNPDRYHAILFDQRGAGRSYPYLSRKDNTLEHYIADIEAIRVYLNIDRWLVIGGSWGATLALAYAQQYPERVAGLVLRGIFLGTDREVAWAFIEGPQRFYPDLYRSFVEELPLSERKDVLQSYIKRLNNPQEAVYFPAALVWNAYERALSQLMCPIPDFKRIKDTEMRLPPTPLFEAHFIDHNFFLRPNQILQEAYKLRGIPGTIVQSRYDLLCPPFMAQELKNRWQEASLQFVEGAGHAMTEKGVFEALKNALDALASKVFVFNI